MTSTKETAAKKAFAMTLIAFILFILIGIHSFQLSPRATEPNSWIHKPETPTVYITQYQNNPSGRKNTTEKNILDGCYHVYLDVGSNIGVQIRKLYEPKLYVGASILPIFDDYFGDVEERLNLNKTISDGWTVCAVGFEPNSHHSEYLKQIESSYQKCGWKVKMMTETAVSDRNGITKFYSDMAFQNLEWGGGVLPPGVINIAQPASSEYKNVSLIRLSEFIRDVVGTRRLPSNAGGSKPPRVVMKMDIEGSEVDVMNDLIFSGALQHINLAAVEWHGRLQQLSERKSVSNRLQQALQLLSSVSEVMRYSGRHFAFKVLDLDDESFWGSRFEMPKC
ncbi:uncharacterized protein LOC134840293 [Symsagittifera roscoffensis]|uniref:uncharacterized protein LOC134840293 n=1 Tax=Symsagittifera roscoffensis TaxID=84072 RepID=UPI00307C8C58